MDILPQLLVNALIAGSLYALASVGLSLAYGLLRILNFSHGHLMMIGAYVFYWLRVELELGFIVSSVIAVMMVSLLAALSLRIFVIPFLRFSFFLPIVTTLALSTILESVVSMSFGVNVKSLTVGLDISSYQFWSVYITPIQIIIITSAVVILGVVGFTIHGTSFGRKVRALLNHAEAAEALGVSSRLITYAVFIVGTLIAAYAGILVGYETNLQPTMGGTYTIKAFAAMILGGLGNIWGTVIGGYILGLLENLSIGLDLGPYSIPAGYKDAFAFVIILGVLLVCPEGLLRRRARSV